MSWQELESEADDIPFKEQDWSFDPTYKPFMNNKDMTEMLKAGHKRTNIQSISKENGGNLQIATALRGNRTNGGIAGLLGMGQIGDSLKNYPEGPSGQVLYPADPSSNLETERKMYYNYGNKAAIQDPLCTKVDPKKLNPISFDMLSAGIVQSNQKGFKSTLNGVHGKPFIWEAPKFIDKNNNPYEVSEELVSEAVRSAYGRKVKYDHDIHGKVALSASGAQEANLQLPQSQVIPQNKITATMKGIRGRFISGRYAGFQSYV